MSSPTLEISLIPVPRRAESASSPGSQRLEDLQGELLLKHSKKDLDADAIAVQVRGRMKRLMKHFGMDFDIVILDCPPGLSFAALAALDLADHVVVPFRPDFVSQFALDRVAMLIERVETAEQLAGIAFSARRYSCLANYLNGSGHERLLIDQLALDHPLLSARIPSLESIARAFDWDESRQTMEQKYADAVPYLRALHDEVLGVPQLQARISLDLMAKKTKALSGASQDAYFRRVLKAHPTLPAEERDRLVSRLRQDIAQLRLRTHARRDAGMQSPAIATPAPTAASPGFDPFSPNIVVVLRKSGRDAALVALGGIDSTDDLRLLAREQRLSVPPDVSSAEELRAAIVAAAERRIANRLAAAS